MNAFEWFAIIVAAIALLLALALCNVASDADNQALMQGSRMADQPTGGDLHDGNQMRDQPTEDLRATDLEWAQQFRADERTVTPPSYRRGVDR